MYKQKSRLHRGKLHAHCHLSPTDSGVGTALCSNPAEKGLPTEGVASPQAFSAGRVDLHRQLRVIISQQESRVRYPNLPAPPLCLITQITVIILKGFKKKTVFPPA